MGTFSIIGLITSGIIISLGYWAKQRKKGRVWSETTEYHFTHDKTGGKLVRMADVSFISYEDVPEEKQKQWGRSRIPVAPTLSVEIVSSKYGLKPALQKMEEVWMRYGTQLGLVVCPFSKTLFIFEHGKPGYHEQSIYEPFTHPLLPGYEGDFSEYVDEV